MVGEVQIQRPITEVFDRAVDEPSWNPAMTSVQWLTAPPIGAGTRYRALMGGRWPTNVEITEFDRPRRLATRTSSSWLSTTGALALSEDPSGATRLRWDWQYRLHGWVRMLGPVFALLGPKWERRNWERLRELLESPGN
jgi:hypothetical protein